MDFLKKAKELGARASTETSRAVSASKVAGAKLKDGITDKVNAQVSSNGFGSVAMKAMDKSTTVMLSSTIKLFNSVVKRLAEEPKYYLVTNEVYLTQIMDEVTQRGEHWSSYSTSDLIRLRAIFSNSYKSLSLGSEVNRYLGTQLAERIDVVECALKSDDDTEIQDPQALSVLEVFQSEGVDVDNIEPEALRSKISSIVNTDQHYFDQVYKGLELIESDEAAALAKLGAIGGKPHYLVRSFLARSTKDREGEQCMDDIDFARACRPGCLNLYDSCYASNLDHSEEVLFECRKVLGASE